MRDPIQDLDRLQHILAISNVLLEWRQKYTFEEIQANPILYYGFVKHVEMTSKN